MSLILKSKYFVWGYYYIMFETEILNNSIMSAIIIESDTENNKLLSIIAKKMGANVFSIKDEQFEEIALGKMMDNVKTGEEVNREEIFDKLRSK